MILGSVDSGYTWAASLLDQCWVGGSSAATKSTYLPPVAVSPYGTRVAERESFVHLARGGSASLVATPTSATTPHSSLSTAAATPPAPTHHGGGPLTAWSFVVVLLAVLLACVFLRRRVVKRRRARRIARRARAKAMRSGSLPIVDGRYRTGTRLGKPLESQVRVERKLIDLTQNDGRPSTDRGAAPRRSR